MISIGRAVAPVSAVRNGEAVDQGPTTGQEDGGNGRTPRAEEAEERRGGRERERERERRGGRAKTRTERRT
jgi:hypothetical protein